MISDIYNNEPSPYTLLDSGAGKKLESFGPYKFIRPAAGAVWEPRQKKLWKKVDGRFQRNPGGDGIWQFDTKLPERWPMSLGDLQVWVSPTDFGHLGIFPEHLERWTQILPVVRNIKEETPFRVLNLFAYTGAFSLGLAAAGAHVVHLDASKTSVKWGRDNAELSGLANKPVRWIVDDVSKFVAREERRGNTYQGIILDPPSYGRGPKGEIWKVEDHLGELLRSLAKITAPNFGFVLLSCHSPGFTGQALKNLLLDHWSEKFSFQAGEMLLPENQGQRSLPSGSYCLLTRNSHDH